MPENIELNTLDLRYQGYRLRDDAREARLLSSIAQRGIEEPLEGVDTPAGRLLLNGFKRFRCAKKLYLGAAPYVSLGEEEAAGILMLMRTRTDKGLGILEQAKFVVDLLTIHGMGLADVVAEAVRDDTALVSIMLCNNETGVRFPVEAIAALCHERGALVHVDAVQAPELLQLHARELALRRPPATQHHHLADPTLTQRGQGVIRDVGGRQHVGIRDQDTSHVHRHVAVPDDDRPLVRQVEFPVRKVGVAVVPGDELGRGMAAPKVLARDSEPTVRLRAEGVDDVVVVPAQVRPIQVPAHGHVAEEAHVGLRRDPVVLRGDLLDRRMVRRDALPHQPVRRGQAVEHVDPDLEAVIATWPDLPDSIRAAIITLVRATAGASDGGRNER